MSLGPFTFSLPVRDAARLLIDRLRRRREYRIQLIGTFVGTGSLWFLALVSGRQTGFIFAAIIFTSLSLSLPIGIRYQSWRLAKKWAGVAKPQTWEFNSSSIVVVNHDGRIITSPWSTIKSITEDEKYIYLIDRDGGRSPIPRSIIGESGNVTLRAFHAEATRAASIKSADTFL